MGRHKKTPEPTPEPVGESEGAKKARLAEQEPAEQEKPAEQETETRTTTTPEMREPQRGDKRDVIFHILDKHPELGRDNQRLAELCNEEARSRGINMTVSPAECGSYKAMRKSKAEGSDNSALFTSRQHTTKREASATDLKKVKKVADERGGVKQLAEDLQDLIALAEEVGGLSSLQECIDFWMSMED